MRDLAKALIDARELALTEHGGQGGQGLDLQESLDFVERFAMGRVADTETVICQSAILVLIGCNIDIAIIEIVVRIVPVSVLDVSRCSRWWSFEGVFTFCRNQCRASALGLCYCSRCSCLAYRIGR